jgi:hypothetical protein
MINIDAIASQVKHNCNISDAKYWGYYSPCGLLLRLRDLYRTENSFKPRVRISHQHIGKWIEARETLWGELESGDYRKIEINGRKFGPFEAKGINSVISEHGFIYGAGYGNMLKPVFILAGLYEQRKMKKFNIYISGRELARDLSTSPAMIQGNTILMRHETMKQFIQDKFEEMKSKRCSGFLHRAFSEYGVSRDTDKKVTAEEFDEILADVAEKELMTYMHHEFGEASQRRILGKWWKQLLMEIPYSRAELYLRSLKDVHSDTCGQGMLLYIINNRKAGSLGFYVAMLTGLRRIIFPEIIGAYEEFLESGDWAGIERARVKGYRKVRESAVKLKAMFDAGRISQKDVEELIP